MNARIQAIGKRLFYTARKSAMLRRVVAMPVFAATVNRICQRVLRPAVGYPLWIKQRLADRRDEYRCQGEPGLLSFLSTVWNTPLHLLKPAVESLLNQQTLREFQWVVVDNGSTSPEVVRYLANVVAADARVEFLHAEKNLGIVGGMHLAMSKATGKYVLPFDSDDLLQPDAVVVLTHQLKAMNYPPLVYSDEDKLDGSEPCWPYFKPDWDPVLFNNSCYVAHLGCMDRALAIELGVYTDSACEGCHDWDAFMRFTNAGYVPAHIPEMLYSWRMHGNSTSVNTRSKNYIFDSQRQLLNRYLDASSLRDKFELQLSPMFQGSSDWRLKRKEQGAMPIASVLLSDSPMPVLRCAEAPDRTPNNPVLRPTSEPASGWVATLGDDLVLITVEGLKLDQEDWSFEVTGLFERYPDAVMIGGLVVNSKRHVVESARVPGFAGAFGCPDRRREAVDPGQGGQLWKQRSVSGVSTHLCVMRANFLRQVIEEFSGHKISWGFLGAWAALLAWRTKQRVIYSPFLCGVSDLDPDRSIAAGEIERFEKQAGDFLQDSRYYSRHFSRRADRAYVPGACSLRSGSNCNPLAEGPLD